MRTKTKSGRFILPICTFTQPVPCTWPNLASCAACKLKAQPCLPHVKSHVLITSHCALERAALRTRMSQAISLESRDHLAFKIGRHQTNQLPTLLTRETRIEAQCPFEPLFHDRMTLPSSVSSVVGDKRLWDITSRFRNATSSKYKCDFLFSSIEKYQNRRTSS